MGTEGDWFVAAVAADGVLAPSTIFAPGSDVRVGRATANELVVPGSSIESHVAVSSGAVLHLLPGSHARMSDAVAGLTVAEYEADGPDVPIAATRVKLVLASGLTVLLAFFATREEAEALVGEQERAREGG